MAIKAFHNLVKIKADNQGNAPKTIELLRTGTWQTPWHGEFEITPEDIKQFVVNADKGIGLVEADPKIPLNYGHESWDKAAGWIPKVYASEDGLALLADPEWTPAAAQAIKDGEWKYISPEFNPRDYPWEDPEQEYSFVSNVLTGAALTNIPLFKKLKPISASRLPNKSVKADTTGDSKQSKKGEPMELNLEEVRTKKAEDLTAEEKTFLEEKKADLTVEELTTFGLTAEVPQTPETPEVPETPETPEVETPETPGTSAPTKVEASALNGVTAEELAQLRADAAAGREAQQKLARTEAEAIITASVKAGQIKSGESDRAVKLLLASRGDQRAELEAFIKGLPVNASLGNELGDDGAAAKGNETAAVELERKIRASIKASAKDGKQLPYFEARQAILDEDEALAARIKNEEEGDK